MIVNNRTGVGGLVTPSISSPFDFQNVLLFVKYDVTVKTVVYRNGEISFK